MTETESPALLPVEVGEDLAALIAAHPLPEGVEDADLNQDGVASAFNKTVNTVAKWTKDGMPFVQEGGPGKSYVYRLSHCWAWFQDRDARLKAEAAHASKQVSALQAHFLGLDVDQPEAQLSWKDRQEMARADLIYQQAARGRRSLVPLDDVVELAEALLVTAREGLSNLADRLERELGLSAAQVSAVQRAATDTIKSMRAKIERAELVERDDDDGLL
ncbi:terminase small subunit [Rhodobacter sp. NTK016B]|uniref:terminase small subunit n=1 Tax=Rhodobacter sp. NTK016B TaxID=2759676 RepID=UPI001A8BF4F6|nr:terminase small subunit [Rhodobacter sp. NTK016B]MBN8291038.1 terminase small subunit [Rhodobacter sp. NTK016B]